MPLPASAGNLSGSLRSIPCARPGGWLKKISNDHRFARLATGTIGMSLITYGALRAQLESLGTPIGNNDLWIAAHALTLSVTLVSNNSREFERVPRLKLQNWAE